MFPATITVGLNRNYMDETALDFLSFSRPVQTLLAGTAFLQTRLNLGGDVLLTLEN